MFVTWWISKHPVYTMISILILIGIMTALHSVDLLFGFLILIVITLFVILMGVGLLLVTCWLFEKYNEEIEKYKLEQNEEVKE